MNNTALRNIIFFIIFAGSLWGFSEVVINSAIKASGMPFRAGILTGIAFFLMGVMGGYLKKARYIFPIVIPALFIVQMGIVLCDNPFLCKANSCVALVLHAGVLSSLFYAVSSDKENISYRKTAITGAAAAFSSAIAFYFIGMRCAPCSYLLSFNSIAGFSSYFLAEVLPWAIFGSIGFSSGYLIGTKLKKSLEFGYTIKLSYYMTGIIVSVACWIISAITII